MDVYIQLKYTVKTLFIKKQLNILCTFNCSIHKVLEDFTYIYSTILPILSLQEWR